MAKFTPSPLISSIQGSVVTVQFRRTQSGPVLSGKNNPLRTDTHAKLAARATLTAVSRAWSSSAMQPNRAGWKTLADTVLFKDKFGTLRHPTAKNLFMSANISLLSIAQPQITVAPASYSAGSPTDVAVAITITSALDIEATPATPPASTEAASIFASRVHKQSVKSAGNTWRRIWYSAPGDPGPYPVGPSFHNLIGTVRAGQLIFIDLRYVSSVSGCCGTRVQGIGVAVLILTLTAVTQTAGINEYTYTAATFSPPAPGMAVTITGFTTTGNNGAFTITATGPGTFKVSAPSGATETASASATVTG